MIYKLYKNIANQDAAYIVNKNGSMTSFLFDPANTDYQTFKKEVLAGAELQDAEGVVMTDASAFIATLP
jgi:hypothetical protein